MTILATLYLAQALCGPYPAMAAALLKDFGEVPVSRGVLPEGRGAVELLVGPAGSFSVIAVMPNGMACFVVSGEGWRAVEPGKPT